MPSGDVGTRLVADRAGPARSGGRPPGTRTVRRRRANRHPRPASPGLGEPARDRVVREVHGATRSRRRAARIRQDAWMEPGVVEARPTAQPGPGKLAVELGDEVDRLVRRHRPHLVDGQRPLVRAARRSGPAATPRGRRRFPRRGSTMAIGGPVSRVGRPGGPPAAGRCRRRGGRARPRRAAARRRRTARGSPAGRAGRWARPARSRRGPTARGRARGGRSGGAPRARPPVGTGRPAGRSSVGRYSSASRSRPACVSGRRQRAHSPARAV